MPIPEILNHYRILGPLGQGGMGEVYVAEDTRLNRKVAVKVLSNLMASDPERRQRFQREAQAVAALNHPNIVTIHSVEEADGVPFLTMELVEGKPLGELIGRGGLPLDLLLRLGIGVSDAMAAAHQRGITHRDLKPANIMVTPDGRVKVLDFGLAKLREAQAEDAADAAANDVTRAPSGDLTGEGRIIGTVAYMSPEQAEGKPVDQRSDIFSLGVVLHELATGEKPFKGDTNVSVISSILKDTPSAITDLNPSLPSGLARVIRRSLAKDPSRRYQTATDLRNELEELKQEVDSGVTVSANAVRPAAGTHGGRPGRAIIAAVVILGLAAAGLGYVLWTARGRETPDTALGIRQLRRLTNTGNASLAAVSPDGRYVAHVKIEGGRPSLWMRQTATTSDVEIVPPADVRYDGVTYGPDGDYVYYTAYATTGGVATLHRVPALGGTPQRVLEDVDSRISFSPDRSQFTFTRGAPAEGTSFVMVADADGHNVRTLAELAPPAQFSLAGPSWSPDGRTIVAPAQSLAGGPHALTVAVDVASGTTTPLEGRWSFLGDLEWLPDGRSFLSAASEFGPDNLQLWQITYPENSRRRITNDLTSYVSLSLSADASSLATVQQEIRANLWVTPADAPSGGQQVTRGRAADGPNGVDWISVNRIVYGSNMSGQPQIWSIDAEGTKGAQLTSQPQPVFAPTAAPDGRRIAFQRFNDSRMQIWSMNADGSDQKRLTDSGLDLRPVAGPGGIVYYSATVKGVPRPFRVPIDGGGEPTPLGDYHFAPIDVSPDGTRLLGVSWDAEARRSSVALMPVTGGPPRLLPGIPAFGGAFTPDGEGVAFWTLDQGTVRFYRYTLETGRTEAFGTIPDSIFAAAWSPDGSRLALSRGQVSSDVVLMALEPERR